jgi:hypothetical protein
LALFFAGAARITLSKGLAKQHLCAIKDHSANSFASKYQDVGNARLTIVEVPALDFAAHNICRFGLTWRSVRL